MSAPSLGEWTAYFAVQAGAAATLSGLVFVAISLNIHRILKNAGLAERAASSGLHAPG